MKKSKRYVSNLVSLNMVSALALGMSHDLNAQETLTKKEVTSIEVSKNFELSKVAGFAQYLPKESDIFINFSKTKEIVQYLRHSKLGEQLAKFTKMAGEDIDTELARPAFKEFLNVAGEEVFFGMGDETGKLVKTTGDIYAEYYQAYYAGLAGVMLKIYEGEDVFQDPEAMQGMFGDMFKPMMEKLSELKDHKMPSTYIGFKVSDADARVKYLNIIKEALRNADVINENLPGMELPFEPDSTKAYGGFEGVKVNYGTWMKTMFSNPEMKEGFEMMGMDEKFLNEYVEVFKDLKITALVGEYQGYVVIYLGDSSAGLKFAENIESSLAVNKEMSFLKEYKEKEVTSIAFVSEEVVDAYKNVSTIMEDLAGGLNKVLSGTESLGNTKHIQALLTKIAKNGRLAVDSTPASRYGSVAYIEDGYKIDSFYGSKSALFDLDAKRKLSNIVMNKDAAFSANWVNNEENSKLTIQRLEDVVNLAYQTTKMVVEHDQKIEDPDFQEFAAIFRMLDAQFSDDLLSLWNSIKLGMQEGMGNERAIVMDLKGSMPRIPDVPTVVLENGKIPRLAIGSDLKSREKMAESWKGADVTGKQIAIKAERFVGQKLNYRTPELAKKKGIDFWSYQLGITSHEANLALGINEQMAFVTTSPAFVESFTPNYDAIGKEEGVDVKINAAPMRDAANAWFKLIEEEGEGLGVNKDEFLENMELIDQWLEASKEIESLDYSVRQINGEVRTYFHLNKAN